MIKMLGKKRKVISLLLAVAMMAALLPAMALASSHDEVWVNHSFNSNTSGWNETHFTTIQTGINAAASGGIVNVTAGNYTERVYINKPLTLKGNNAGVSAGTVPATRKSESLLSGGIQINASNVTVDGFTITRGGKSGQIITNNILSGPGRTTHGIFFGNNADDIMIRNNEIRNWLSGIYINPSRDIIIEGNYINANYVGIDSDGISNVSILRNNIYDNYLEGWAFSDVENLSEGNLLSNNNNFVRDKVELNQLRNKLLAILQAQEN